VSHDDANPGVVPDPRAGLGCVEPVPLVDGVECGCLILFFNWGWNVCACIHAGLLWARAGAVPFHPLAKRARVGRHGSWTMGGARLWGEAGLEHVRVEEAIVVRKEVEADEDGKPVTEMAVSVSSVPGEACVRWRVILREG